MENTALENIFNQSSNTITIGSFILSIISSYILTSIISKIYKYESNTLSNPQSLSKVLPLLSITTTIIISVVKSSLALSLGLVGALSIVRFRTPIKEPEELTYIFLSIAIGLATGANQYKASFIGVALTIFFIYLPKWLSRKKVKSNLIKISINGLYFEDMDSLLEIVASNAERVDFYNLGINSIDNKKITSLTLSIIPKSFVEVNNIAKEISNKFESVSLTIFDSQY